MGSRFVETDVFRFSYTPENEHGSPKNHSEKEKNLNPNLHEFGFQAVKFFHVYKTGHSV